MVLGAGKSASVLIGALAQMAEEGKIAMYLADLNQDAAQKAAVLFPKVTTSGMDLENALEMEQLLNGSFLVVSLLPAHLHPQVGRYCIKAKAHLITASYISAEMQALHKEAEAQNLLFLNECGLDPGIDHISAMQLFNQIRLSGGKVESFKSWCGGLVSLRSNDNPWGYKISWNPRNVVNAGKGTARFKADGAYKYLPYHRLFAECWQVDAASIGLFEGYANRDSLGYTSHFGLEEAKTIIRGTLRMPNYCKAWNVLVQLGLTDDSFVIQLSKNPTWADFTRAFVPMQFQNVELKEAIKLHLGAQVANETALNLLEWMGLFSQEAIEMLAGDSPADLLLRLMEKKWKLNPNDTDRVVMIHEIEYSDPSGRLKKVTSSLDLSGEEWGATAMAKTVGLPLYLGALWLLEGKAYPAGVQMPTWSAFVPYALSALEQKGIVFKEIWD